MTRTPRRSHLKCPEVRCPESRAALAAFDTAKTQKAKLQALSQLVKIRENYWLGYNHAIRQKTT